MEESVEAQRDARHAALLDTGVASANKANARAKRRRNGENSDDDDTTVTIRAASAALSDAQNVCSRKFVVVEENRMSDATVHVLNEKRRVASCSPRAPPILACVPMDIWRKLLAHVDTHSIRMLALTCASMAVVSRCALTTRIIEHPDMDAQVHLLPEQRKAFELAVYKRQNVFLTGEAGSGKSVTFRAIAAGLRNRQRCNGNPPVPEKLTAEERARYETLRVVLAAPTGTAAEVCGGQTLASIFGVFPDEPVDVEEYRMRIGTGDAELISDMDVLMIDEVSMISEQGFALIDRILRLIRRSRGQPFGGVQLVTCGDFAQLPPVSRSTNPILSRRCFTSPLWSRMFGDPYNIDEPRMVMLPTSVRQKDDEHDLRAVLAELRCFSATQRVSDLLRRRSFAELKRIKAPELTQPSVVIAATNATVNTINNNQMTSLIEVGKAAHNTYLMWYNRDANGRDKEAPGPVQLAVGARVSMTRNALPFHLSNGSLGVVVAFAYVIDPNIFLPASRVTSLASTPLSTIIVLSGFDIVIDKNTRRVLSSRERIGLDGLKFPVVEFDSQPGRRYMVTYWGTPISIPRREEKEYGPLTRYHVPLRVAYAQTIHRAQGCTLHCVVRLDMEACFQPEQLYVALSRVRTLKQLVIIKEPNYMRIYNNKLMPNDTIRFLNTLNMRLELIHLAHEKELAAIQERTKKAAAAVAATAAKTAALAKGKRPDGGGGSGGGGGVGGSSNRGSMVMAPASAVTTKRKHD